MIYLASPYSHPDAEVREQRFRAACLATARLLHAGHVVFSPIAHSHPLVQFGLPTDWAFWARHDREHLERSDELLVLMLPGWQPSVGVQKEIEIAHALGIPVRLLDPVCVLKPESDSFSISCSYSGALHHGQ